ncbi:MAG: ABC transporter substrate-binding protein [Gammaproteobacteria bacterium]|jgi:phospholipid transport system substrate-binding protein|nr:ABC transporter substrate-binding protein [Gammaproteobacteria bacterium]MBT6043119.1 ABC transporter substrate-binding protein [Gammaproteobacteria bacterium]
MNYLRRMVMVVGFFAGSAALSFSSMAAQEMTAEEAVDLYISGLLSKMEQIKPLYESDRNSYFDNVESALAEFVDFREVARGVMAKYGQGPNGASAEQLDRFAVVFRASLVEFYGSALAEYGGVEYEILENTQQSSNPERSSNVRMSILGDDGDRIEVQYTMFLNDERSWKLRNLYVEGVNLRRQYYSRFDNLMNRNEFEIDKVIDLWQIEQ